MAFYKLSKEDKLTREEIELCIDTLNEELRKENLQGRLLIFGGTVMCLVYETRDTTRDVDSLYEPKSEIDKIIRRIARKYALKEDWMNDAMKGVFCKEPYTELYKQMSNLEIRIPTTEYMLALKVNAFRDDEFHYDVDDIKFLIAELDIRSIEQAILIIQKHMNIDNLGMSKYYKLEGLIEDHVNKTSNQ